MLGTKWLRSNFLMVIMLLVRKVQPSQIDPGAFARTSGTHFVVNNKPMFLNGFNAYWLMYMASDPSTREKVTSTLQEASMYGMNVARTLAFSDGVIDRPLQISPGGYNEESFKGLDFVISEASKNGIYLILSLVNNFNTFGGRAQYVQWARERGQPVTSDDDFYANLVVKEYYKNHVKKWVKEMAAHAKSIDNIHLLEVGHEGFYGPSKQEFNSSKALFGTDFISNNLIPEIDFTTIHLYPEPWLPKKSEQHREAFVDRWIQAHVQDCDVVLKKPIIITEFGESSRSPGFRRAKRDGYFSKIYNAIYSSAQGGGSFAGGLFWQLMAQGMDSWGDGYQFVLGETPSTANFIARQSRKLAALTG